MVQKLEAAEKDRRCRLPVVKELWHPPPTVGAAEDPSCGPCVDLEGGP